MFIWHIVRNGCLCCAFLAAVSVVGSSQTSAVAPVAVSPGS